MSTATATPQKQPKANKAKLTAARLPSWFDAAVLLGGVAVAALLHFVLSMNIAGAVVLGWLLALVVLFVVSFSVEGRRFASDRVMRGLIVSTFLIALLPLVSVLWKVIAEGAPYMTSDFLMQNQEGVYGDVRGGAHHAIIGTLLVTLGAAVISIPIGIFTAIYLVEYSNKGGWFAGTIRFLVDVMTGIPSIVAGLFAYSLFIVLVGPRYYGGIIGSVALSVLMIPIVVRSTEEMLKLVPHELRESAYALGVPKWRTIAKVVVPTALAGILTGVTLSIARVIGETAPLLVTVGVTSSDNFSLFSGQIETLPTFVYQSIAGSGGNPEDPQTYNAWAAALTLMIIVMILNLFARLLSKLFSPKGEK